MLNAVSSATPRTSIIINFWAIQTADSSTAIKHGRFTAAYLILTFDPAFLPRYKHYNTAIILQFDTKNPWRHAKHAGNSHNGETRQKPSISTQGELSPFDPVKKGRHTQLRVPPSAKGEVVTVETAARMCLLSSLLEINCIGSSVAGATEM